MAELLTYTAAARLLGVDRSRVRAMVASGLPVVYPPPTRTGRRPHPRIVRETLLAWIRQQERRAQEQPSRGIDLFAEIRTRMYKDSSQ